MSAKTHANARSLQGYAEKCSLQGLKSNAVEDVTWGLKPPPPKERKTVATRVALGALRFYKAYLSLLVGGSFLPNRTAMPFFARSTSVAFSCWMFK